MDKVIFGLCALTALACALLLLGSYLRTRFRLLLWSGLCFVGLSFNNILLLLDRFVFLDVDLSAWRLGLTLVSLLLLVGGLVWEDGS